MIFMKDLDANSGSSQGIVTNAYSEPFLTSSKLGALMQQASIGTTTIRHLGTIYLSESFNLVILPFHHLALIQLHGAMKQAGKPVAFG